MHHSWSLLFENYDFDISKVYPPQEFIFRVFEIDVKDIKIVLLGQDPYHKPNQANGLSFSVSNNIKKYF
jgi:uracil-DNA glycosylase